MVSGQMQDVVRHFRKILAPHVESGLSDAELLGRFCASRDESAFELLVWRHHRMVLGVCSRILRDPNDVEDAFQACFLVLACRAQAVRKRASVASWLYGVARRVALKASCRRTRQQSTTPSLPVSTVEEPGADLIRSEWRLVLDEELMRLPEKYRRAVILCYFNGKTYAEAGRELGWPVGTVASRLTRARQLLHDRLTRRGLVLSAGTLTACLTCQPAGALAQGLVSATARMAAHTTGHLWAGAAAPQVLSLTRGVLQMMGLTKLKLAAAALVVALIGAVATPFCLRANADGPAAELPRQAPTAVVAAHGEPATGSAEAQAKQPAAPRGDTVDVAALIGGKVVAVAVKAGQQVHAGDVLLRLDDGQALTELKRAEQDLEVALARSAAAQASVADVAAKLARSKELLKLGAIAQAEYQTVVTAHAQATQELKVTQVAASRAKEQVASAQAYLTRHTLRSPVDGVVKTIFQRKGEVIKAEDVVAEIQIDKKVPPPPSKIGNLESFNKAKAALQAAEANLKAAEAEYALARARFEKLKIEQAERPKGKGPQPPPIQNEAENGALSVKVYPVGDLAGKDGAALIGVIIRTIEPKSWETVGGPGTIQFFPAGQSLVVNQSAAVHLKIHKLLGDLRAAKSQPGKK